MRGKLTDKVKKISIELLGYEITQEELRLMPYLLHCSLNYSKINDDNLNNEEFTILNEWVMKGFIAFDGNDSDDSFSKFSISKKFFSAISELMWLSYVSEKLEPKETIVN